MRQKSGFTLVELLVVIAIITILAATVLPRLVGAIGKARMARAHSEIKSMDLALTKMLTDADKKHFGFFFAPGSLANVANARGAYYVYGVVFYELLRRGRDANLSDLNLALLDSVKKKLGTTYMDVGRDPWGENNYFFYAGPINRADAYYNALRSYRSPVGELGDVAVEDGGNGYVYDVNHYNYENTKMRGNQLPDDARGYPAPRDLPVYVWAAGENTISDQNGLAATLGSMGGGGDDVNSWDSAAGWSEFY